MEGYIGERTPPLAETPYATYDKSDWTMLFIDKYGGIEGARHKQWILDTILRINKGAPVLVKLAEWADDTGTVVNSEYRFEVGTCEAYDAWIKEREDEGYDWDPGT